MKHLKWYHLLLIWAALGLVHGLINFTTHSMQGIVCYLPTTLMDQVPNFTLWTAYTPLIAIISARFNLFDARLFWLIHVPLGIMIALAHATMVSWIQWQFYTYEGSYSYIHYFNNFLREWFLFDLMLYGFIWFLCLRFPEWQGRPASILKRSSKSVRESDYLDKITVKDRSNLIAIATDDVIAIEAYDSYVKIVTAQRAFLHRTTINALHAQLNPDHFARIHRSTIVKLELIASIKACGANDNEVVLSTGHVYRVSRSRKKEVKQYLDA